MPASSNLLKNDWTVSQLEAVLARHPRKPLLPPAGSDAWRRAGNNPVVRRYTAPLFARAEREAAEPIPALTDELYASFHRTGSRVAFERVYFEKRRLLARAVICLLLCDETDPRRQLYADSAMRNIASILDDVSWSLPAHVNSFAQDQASGKDPLQLDLMCTETANVMAELRDLLGDIMPAPLQARIRARLHNQVFLAYLDETILDRYSWKQCTHNWNAVCHQGIVGAALSQIDDPRLLARILASAAQCLPFFLSGFGPDGGCSEGPGYWNYGFGWFAELNRQLELRTGGELSLFEGDEHVRAIAGYGPLASFANGNLVNFSDTSATGGLRPSLLVYLGERLADRDLTSLAKENYRMFIAEGLDLEAERCDLFHLVRFILRCPDDLSDEARVVRRDCFLPDLAVLVARGTDAQGHLWEFAAKGGHNNEHHNHNDCGNFILNIDGVRVVAEIGAPEYVKDFFGPRRYEFLAARSMGHSLPVINGQEQAEGREHAATITEHVLGADAASLTVDITACYPASAGCKKAVRAFRLDKAAGRLSVEDTFELARAESLETAIITLHPAFIQDGHVVIRTVGFDVVLKPAPGTKAVGVGRHEYRTRNGGQTAFINRIVLATENLAASTRLGFSLTLA